MPRSHSLPDVLDRDTCATLSGFFLGVRLAITLAFVQILGAEPRSGSAAVLAVQAVLMVFVIFARFGTPAKPLAVLLQPSTVRWVVTYLSVAACSLLWSVTASPLNSVAYLSGLFGDLLLICLLLRSGHANTIAPAMMRGYVMAACAIAVAAWLMPAQADLRLGDEDFLNTNQIGNLCAVALLFVQYLRRSGTRRYSLSLLLLILTLLRSLSKSTLIAFALSQLWTLLRDRTIPRKAKVKIAACSLVVLLAFSGLFAAYYDVYTNAGNQAQTFTGRTAIWAYVSGEIVTRPWFGHGFDSMWKVVPPFGPDRFEARHAENELLQQLYSYGVGGVILVAGVYGALGKTARRLPRGPQRMLLSGLLLYTLVRGLAVAEPFDLLLPLWMCVLFAVSAHQAANDELLKTAFATQLRGPLAMSR